MNLEESISILSNLQTVSTVEITIVEHTHIWEKNSSYSCEIAAYLTVGH